MSRWVLKTTNCQSHGKEQKKCRMWNKSGLTWSTFVEWFKMKETELSGLDLNVLNPSNKLTHSTCLAHIYMAELLCVCVHACVSICCPSSAGVQVRTHPADCCPLEVITSVLAARIPASCSWCQWQTIFSSAAKWRGSDPKTDGSGEKLPLHYTITSSFLLTTAVRWKMK